jgi:hypothetical protein
MTNVEIGVPRLRRVQPCLLPFDFAHGPECVEGSKCTVAGLRNRGTPCDAARRRRAGRLGWYSAICILQSAILLAGCSGAQQTRRDVYLNLMTPLQQARYRYLEATQKPVSLRLAYLQEIGIYQKWADQSEKVQQAILRCQVLEGMTPLQVQMAWGSPDQERNDTPPADRAEGHTRTLWDYGMRDQNAGEAGYERTVCFFDGVVLWVRTP